MKGTKYLSELVDCSQFQKNKLNIIEAPTGCGKTYFALQYIPKLSEDATHKIVYLIDTINGKEQIIKNYNAISEYRDWMKDVQQDGIWFLPEDKEKIVIITYAKFGILLSKDPDFHKNFDYILCDELHSLIKFQGFQAKPNNHSITKYGLERAVKNDRTIVIALSATPSKIKTDFAVPHYEIPIDKEDLIRYETKEVIRYGNLDYILSSLDVDKKGICYAGHITQMLGIEETAKENGFHPICLWSTQNQNYPMDKEQLAVRQTILDTYRIPEQYDLLIINSSSETSLKIKSHIDFVIVHHTNLDTQIQVRGRVNADLDELYLPTIENDNIVIPNEFLGVRLFREDKTKLCDILNLRDRSGRRYQWNTIKQKLIDSDYILEEGRLRGSSRYTIITQASE